MSLKSQVNVLEYLQSTINWHEINVKYACGSLVKRTTIVFAPVGTSILVSMFKMTKIVTEREAALIEYQLANWGYDITNRDIFDTSVREGEGQDLICGNG